MLSVGIVDILGLAYDGSTLSTRGLGGSESAIILISRELVKLGFDVTVYNDCEDSQAKPGVYDGVKYLPIRECSNRIHDILISSRTIFPFCLEHQYTAMGEKRHPYSTFDAAKKAKLKILWMHDTFCGGQDHIVEELVVAGLIDEIFTLSDFHTSYIANCDHGRRRNFEVLKNKIFITRNGVVNHKSWVDIKQKDPNLFVYNASFTKGMLPLVTKIWPELKLRIPDAKLTCIGGFYRFRENAEPDWQERDWNHLRNTTDPKLSVEFTGVIPQFKVADILSRASYFLYPCAFPETYGISMMESMLYNTPMVTCRFGATEETAYEDANYIMDYAIEPNSLFPWINSDAQCARFVDIAERAHKDKYLHQQKMYACNRMKDHSGWDSVALQWKQHFYKKMKMYLPIDEYRRVSDINNHVHRVFGRRFSNHEEWRIRKTNEQKIVVVTPFYNAREYIEECVESVIAQDYENWEMILIDDKSTDDGAEVVKNYVASLPESAQRKIRIKLNEENVGAVCNQVLAVRGLHVDDIVMLVDGDDALANDPHIFDRYNNMFHAGTEFSYGSCWSMADDIPLVAQPYPPEVRASKSYRQYKFNWNMPYTHLRVFRKRLIDDVNNAAFQDEKGVWFKAGGDNSTFYNILEQADPDKIAVVSDIVYLYNDKNPINDYKVNGKEQNQNMEFIVNGGLKMKITDPAKTKKILIAIPTAKYIEPETFKAIYDLDVPDGYETDFQFFFGYNVDQVRNLIAHWAQHYDYLFSIDSDIVMPRDTLTKFLKHDKDIVTGMYIQRIPGTHALELYGFNGRIPYEVIKNQGLVEIDGCGFGCVLVKSEVFKKVGYPQFVYHSAIDHKDTISEDTDFCRKARENGFKIFVDTSVKCGHKGTTWFNVEDGPAENEDQSRLRHLGNQNLLPLTHVNYLEQLKNSSVNPKVIYDIGACVLHWQKEASRFWPNAQYYMFEAMDEPAFLYKEKNLPYHCGVLTDRDNRIVDFYQNTEHPGGNSYYIENDEVNPEARAYFNDSHLRKKVGMKLDTVVASNNWPLPNLIKIDVQGAELDVLKGASKCLENADDLILELQHTDYNKGAPKVDEVVQYLKSIGFELVAHFSRTMYDGDYHFKKFRHQSV
jgi:FkbM family methyltransferase